MVTLPDAQLLEISKEFDSPMLNINEPNGDLMKRSGSMTVNYGDFGVITGLNYIVRPVQKIRVQKEQ